MNLKVKVQVYYRKFNKLFFDGKVDVKLEFSSKMKRSAGIFYPPDKQNYQARIRLNEPMLSLRSDEEIMETLLHEMTHAHLHKAPKRVKPHGKEFQQKIQEINKALSLNITTTHQYITWYRCTGICRQLESALFGFMSRVANPQNNLTPSREHQISCGGTFVETEKPGKEMLRVISNRCKQIKTAMKLKKKKVGSDIKQPTFFRHARTLSIKGLKIVEYQTSDDEAHT